MPSARPRRSRETGPVEVTAGPPKQRDESSSPSRRVTSREPAGSGHEPRGRCVTPPPTTLIRERRPRAAHGRSGTSCARSGNWSVRRISAGDARRWSSTRRTPTRSGSAPRAAASGRARTVVSPGRRAGAPTPRWRSVRWPSTRPTRQRCIAVPVRPTSPPIPTRVTACTGRRTAARPGSRGRRRARRVCPGESAPLRSILSTGTMCSSGASATEGWRPTTTSAGCTRPPTAARPGVV